MDVTYPYGKCMLSSHAFGSLNCTNNTTLQNRAMHLGPVSFICPTTYVAYGYSNILLIGKKQPDNFLHDSRVPCSKNNFH